MTAIIQHKWKACQDSTFVEKFYYTETGEFFARIEEALSQRSDDVHPGRIMLNRVKQGEFFVDWSTRNMQRIKHEVLGQCREMLVGYLDTLRTKSLIHDIETWTKVIFWSWDSAARGAAILDANGNILRAALWDASKKQYVPKLDLVPRNHGITYELFTPERWRTVERNRALDEEYRAALQVLAHELRSFTIRDNNPVHIKALRSLRDSLRKQTLALQVERKKKVLMDKKPNDQ